MSNKCEICGDIADAKHFGAISCRACAAFFRRQVVVRKKIVRRCDRKCSLEAEHRKFCVSCRFDKCLSCGMRESKVMAKPSGSKKVSTKKLPLLKKFSSFYKHIQNLRRKTFSQRNNSKPRMANYKEVNDIFMKYGNIVKDNIFEAFPEAKKFSDDQKAILLDHFTTPYIICEGTIRAKKYNLWKLPNDDLIDNNHPEYYYNENQNNLKDKESHKLYQASWKVMHENIRGRMEEAKMDLNEYFLLSALIFWDDGLPKQTEEVVEISRKMRKKIIEEITKYENMKCLSKDDASIQVARIIMILQGVQSTVQAIHKTSGLTAAYTDFEKHKGMFETMGI
ncbi:unnamed protein product [Caenorhabditis angaria]|uniref:Nuclear receptor domain-containing protein n=1 Tax=Caenorhabditis angaria TaxID=860376 RepID=A0A9P1ISS2_9PELO|nr:unnamed protein product [Caenorhabditis angaria]